MTVIPGAAAESVVPTVALPGLTSLTIGHVVRLSCGGVGGVGGTHGGADAVRRVVMPGLPATHSDAVFGAGQQAPSVARQMAYLGFESRRVHMVGVCECAYQCAVSVAL